MVCCVEVMQLAHFLIESYEEHFEEEVAGLVGAPAEESPALEAEAETAEVCQVHSMTTKASHLRRWDCWHRDNQGHPPACSSGEWRVRLMYFGH